MFAVLSAIRGEKLNGVIEMKELITKIGDSTLYYDDDMSEFVIDRFDERIYIGDMTEAEAIEAVKEIEE